MKRGQGDVIQAIRLDNHNIQHTCKNCVPASANNAFGPPGPPPDDDPPSGVRGVGVRGVVAEVVGAAADEEEEEEDDDPAAAAAVAADPAPVAADGDPSPSVDAVDAAGSCSCFSCCCGASSVDADEDEAGSGGASAGGCDCGFFPSSCASTCDASNDAAVLLDWRGGGSSCGGWGGSLGALPPPSRRSGVMASTSPLATQGKASGLITTCRSIDSYAYDAPRGGWIAIVAYNSLCSLLTYVPLRLRSSARGCAATPPSQRPRHSHRRRRRMW